MMMPANYSVIAENEMTYVNGGANFIDAIGAVTAPIWDVTNVKTFSTNIVTLIGNKFIGKLVDGTLGVLFSGNTTWGDVKAAPKKLFSTGNGIGDDIANFLGLTAAAYNLGRVDVDNKASSASIGMTQGDGKTHVVIDGIKI
ncbi:hypothetical protein [Faecalibacterium duncaniae]|uniref:hypothetical protein n=1 Tax=Faecalibacterium duncaniae (strain DSM 17677 / JCM 31915 / A2-165) TaxID=411483 RepID=UPI00209E88F8|nr:hypothetical protein [Faecalibacterium duncaniae]UTB39582.1 hypothetical protein NKF69_09805 [Faecalibacterium duncaniae]